MRTPQTPLRLARLLILPHRAADIPAPKAALPDAAFSFAAPSGRKLIIEAGARRAQRAAPKGCAGARPRPCVNSAAAPRNRCHRNDTVPVCTPMKNTDRTGLFGAAARCVIPSREIFSVVPSVERTRWEACGCLCRRALPGRNTGVAMDDQHMKNFCPKCHVPMKLRAFEHVQDPRKGDVQVDVFECMFCGRLAAEAEPRTAAAVH